MEHPNNEERLLQQLREWAWTINGSLEGILILEKSPPNSKLRARVGIKRLPDDVFEIVGDLYAPDTGTIVGRRCIAKIDELLTELARTVVGCYEVYFTGNTNIANITEIYKHHKVT